MKLLNRVATFLLLLSFAGLAYADSSTTNLGLNNQTVGGNPNTWGTNLNGNFTILDAKLGDVQPISTTGGNTNLTAGQQKTMAIVVSGALVSDATITFTGAKGAWIATNNTTGSFSVTFKLAASSGVAIDQGGTRVIYSNATDIIATSLGTTDLTALQSDMTAAQSDITTLEADVAVLQAGGSVPAGSVVMFGGTALPTGYLWCDGSAVNRTTYADLFAALSTTYGAGNGSTTFNVPDVRGRGLFGEDDIGGSAASRITTAGGSCDGATLGTACGSQSVTLTQANLPSGVSLSASGLTLSSGAVTIGSLTVSAGTFAVNTAITEALTVGTTITDTRVITDTSSSNGNHTHSITNGTNVRTSSGSTLSLGTGSNSESYETLTAASNGAHTHTTAIDMATPDSGSIVLASSAVDGTITLTSGTVTGSSTVGGSASVGTGISGTVSLGGSSTTVKPLPPLLIAKCIVKY